MVNMEDKDLKSLIADFKRLTEERDAAVGDLNLVQDCDTCKNKDEECGGEGICLCGYEWRGVQK